MSHRRLAKFYILVGTNGTGKSTVMKKFLSVNERNLVIPPNRFDQTWDDVPEIKISQINAFKKE